jgi:hypothetical protein
MQGSEDGDREMGDIPTAKRIKVPVWEIVALGGSCALPSLERTSERCANVDSVSPMGRHPVHAGRHSWSRTTGISTFDLGRHSLANVIYKNGSKT